jgi:serine protease inhibitor
MGTVLPVHNSARAQVYDLLAAETDPTPTSPAVQVNNNFAADLYRQLAKKHEGDDLFFSPYSIASALVMTAEGARGETARQMGTVLRFPETARGVGDDTHEMPWNTAVIHMGMADLKQRLTGGANTDPTQTQDIRDKIKHLEQEYQTLTRQLKQLESEQQWSQWSEVTQRAAGVAHELNTLRQQVDQYELRIANTLWGEQTFPFRQHFVDTLKEAYGAAALPVDFLHNPEGARGHINQWVAQQTNDRIKDLLAQGMITPDTRLVLANAIYFKGNWADEFDPQQTQEADFTLQDGTKTTARLMASRDREFRYAELFPDGTRNEPVLDRERLVYTLKPNPDGFQLLELPYRGHQLAMIVLLPKKPDGLSALETGLTAANLNKWLEVMQQQKVHVFLPRFTLETTYDLPQTLSAMGMPAAFQPGGFTGVSDAAEASTLALSQVVHKAFVAVNEEGTEAAAATAVTIVATAARIEPPIPTFRADRPFLFLIRDTQSGTLLFLGRMMNPRGAI